MTQLSHFAILWVLLESSIFEAPHEDELRIAAHSYLENAGGLQQFTCRFRTTFGAAAKWEDIPAERLQKGFYADGLWIVDGDKCRFELRRNGDDVGVPVPLGDNAQHISVSSFDSEMFLGDSAAQISCRSSIANIHPPEMPASRPTLTPFNANWMGVHEQLSPGRQILDAIRQKKSCAYLGVKRLGESDVTAISVGSHTERQYRFYLDHQRGFLPVETIVTDKGRIVYHYLTTASSQTEQGLWYPTKTYWVAYPSASMKEFNVAIWEIDDFAVGSPGDDAFCLNLPRGMTICEPVASTPAQFTLDADETVCIGQLNLVLEKARRIGDQRSAQAAPAAMKPENHDPGRTGLVLVGNAVLLLVVGLLLLWRGHRSPESGK